MKLKIDIAMTSKDIKQSLSIKIKSSLQKYFIIILPHVISLVIISSCVILFDIYVWYLVITCVFIIASFIYFFRLHIKLNLSNSVLSLYKDPIGNWSIDLKGRVKHKIEILGTSFISEFFIILNVKDESKKQYAVILTKDSVNKDDYRKLKVFINTNQLSH